VFDLCALVQFSGFCVPEVDTCAHEFDLVHDLDGDQGSFHLCPVHRTCSVFRGAVVDSQDGADHACDSGGWWKGIGYRRGGGV